MIAILLLSVATVALGQQTPPPWVVFAFSDRKDCTGGYNHSPPLDGSGNCYTLDNRDYAVSYKVDCARDQTFTLYLGGETCNNSALQLPNTILYQGPTPVCLGTFFFPDVYTSVCCSSAPPTLDPNYKLSQLGGGKGNPTVQQQLDAWVKSATLKTPTAFMLQAKKAKITPFPEAYCFKHECGPEKGTNKNKCLAKAKQGCAMKWLANNCKSKLIPQPSKGCQCTGFCSYGCKAQCNKDNECTWNGSKCDTKPEFAGARDKYCVKT